MFTFMMTYLVASLIISLITFHRDMGYFYEQSKKKTDRFNEQRKKEWEKGELTYFQYKASTRSYKSGFITFFFIHMTKAPVEAPLFLVLILLDTNMKDEHS